MSGRGAPGRQGLDQEGRQPPSWHPARAVCQAAWVGDWHPLFPNLHLVP